MKRGFIKKYLHMYTSKTSLLSLRGYVGMLGMTPLLLFVRTFGWGISTPYSFG